MYLNLMGLPLTGCWEEANQVLTIAAADEQQPADSGSAATNPTTARTAEASGKPSRSPSCQLAAEEEATGEQQQEMLLNSPNFDLRAWLAGLKNGVLNSEHIPCAQLPLKVRSPLELGHGTRRVGGVRGLTGTDGGRRGSIREAFSHAYAPACVPAHMYVSILCKVDQCLGRRGSHARQRTRILHGTISFVPILHVSASAPACPGSTNYWCLPARLAAYMMRLPLLWNCCSWRCLYACQWWSAPTSTESRATRRICQQSCGSPVVLLAWSMLSLLQQSSNSRWSPVWWLMIAS